MRIVDTRKVEKYSPLIPAIKAMCESPKGESLRIIMNNEQAFDDIREYLSEQHIGFREVYDGNELSVEFTL